MHTKKCAQLGLCIGNALVTSASVVHIWALHRKSVFSCSSSHLGSATYFSYFGCSLCTFGLCIGNALVSSAAVCAHLGSASEMHWSLQLRSCGLCIGNALVSSVAVLHTWDLQNALVFFGFVFFSQSCTSHGFWLCKSKRTMTSGTLTMLQKAVASGTLTIFREGKKDLRTVFDLKGDTLFNFSSR